MVFRIFCSLCATVLLTTIVSAQQLTANVAPSPFITGRKAVFTWKGLNWSIPKDLLIFFPASLTREGEIAIDAGYILGDGRFVPFHQPRDLALEVHIRTIDDENPKVGYDTSRRIGNRFYTDAALSSLKVKGMIYLGTSVNIHYFRILGEDAYVECNADASDPRNPATLSNDLRIKTFYCGTEFSLPSGIYAWMRSPYIRLDDVAAVFLATRGEILSYMGK
jgi:hypothetical protein